jgi:hypothetical protein
VKETKRRLRILGLLAGGLLLLAPTPTRASHERFATYEDWTTATIRSDRWFGTSDLGHERLREIKQDKLLVRFRREGGTASDSGSVGSVSNRLLLAQPLSVDQIEADFKVRRLIVTGCAENATSSIARAATIDLTRFSDLDPMAPRSPGSLIGDHIARILAVRRSDSADPINLLSVQAVLFRCNNAACSMSTTVVGPVTLGQVRVKQRFRLRLIWDSPENRFLAGLNDDPDMPLVYVGAVNSRPANVPFAALRTGHVPANCTVASGGPTVADAEIDVGKVRTNASAIVP